MTQLWRGSVTLKQTVRPGVNEGERNIFMLDQRQNLDRNSRNLYPRKPLGYVEGVKVIMNI